MNKLRRKLLTISLITVLSPLFLCNAGIVYAQMNNDVQNQKVDTSICDIRMAASDFVDHEFEVNALLTAGPEGFWLNDKVECEEAESGFRIVFKFASTFQERSQKKLFRAFNKELKQKPEKGTMARKVSGRFEVRVEKYEKSNPKDVLAEYQVVLLRVISVFRD